MENVRKNKGKDESILITINDPHDKKIREGVKKFSIVERKIIEERKTFLCTKELNLLSVQITDYKIW